jgi:hypothetical protein
MVKSIILDLLINSGSFAWLLSLRKFLFDQFDITIPLVWWTVIPAVILVILVNLKIEKWIEKGETVAWRK